MKQPTAQRLNRETRQAMLAIRALISVLLALSTLHDATAETQKQVSAEGFRGVRFGMTVAEAPKAYGCS
jgi:hypothetical protein